MDFTTTQMIVILTFIAGITVRRVSCYQKGQLFDLQRLQFSFQGNVGDKGTCPDGLVWNNRVLMCDWAWALEEDHKCYQE